MESQISVVAEGHGFPECPRWHNGEIWFTLSRQIMITSLDGQMRVFGELEGPLVLGLAFLEDGSILSGSALQRRIYRLFPDGRRDLFADLSDEVADITNECVLGPDGSVYVGSVGFNLLQGESPKPTRLVRIAPDGSISRVGPEMTMPNGMVWSKDGRTLYVAESIGAKITALSVKDDGDLVLDRVVADLSGSDAHHPDGLAVDTDGSLFYADPELPGGVIVHIDGSGREIERYMVGLPYATSCALGGDDGRTLFVTASEAMASPGEDQTQRAAIVSVPLTRSTASTGRR
jgi:sugar lactone lactonase YvrE